MTTKNELEQLTLSSVDTRINVDDNFIRLVKDRLLKDENYPILKKGVIWSCIFLGHKIGFKVVEIIPEEGVVSEKTVLKILGEPKPKKKRHKIKCYKVRPGDELILEVGEVILLCEQAVTTENEMILLIWTKTDLVNE